MKTEEVQQSYVKQLWHAFTKKMRNIGEHVDNDDVRLYVSTFVLSSLESTIMGTKLWLQRNEMVENLVYDSNGNIVSNSDELVAWCQKIEKDGAKVAKVLYKTGLMTSEWISNTGESFTWKPATKLEPITSDFGYKVMLGTTGIIALAAIYSAYKLLTLASNKKTKAVQEN